MNIARGARLLLILVAVSAFLGACQSITPSGEDDEPRGDSSREIIGELEKLDPSGTLVVFWHALRGADEDILLEMIDSFNTSNEWDVTVVGEYQGDVETIYNRVNSDLATDQLPSLVMTDPSRAAAYAAQDVAIPLAPYLESRKWGPTQTERDDFFRSALQADRLPQFDSQLFSFPFCRSLQVLYFNADWLKELGFDGPPQTWDEFQEMSCNASTPAESLYGFEFGMDSALFNSLLATQDASLLNPKATAYTFGDQVGRAGLEYLQELIENGCAAWETEEGHLADFAAGKLLFAIDSTDKLPAYPDAIGDGANFNWGLTSLPYTTDEPQVGSAGPAIAILRTSPEEQLAAWLFLNWLAEAEQQAQWAQYKGCFPLRRSALEGMEAYIEKRPQYGAAAQLLELQWITEPNVTAYEACRTEIERMLYAVTAGESVEEWLADTLERCNQTLADSSE